ncbi:MAG: PAS domain S-box protein [Candidatus Hodarchaeota archaeon]
MELMKYDRVEICEKFNDLFEYSLDLIYVCDLEGNFLDANDITLFSLGYEREEISNLTFLDVLEKDEINKAYGVIKEILKSGKQFKRREYKVRAKNGDFIYIETYGIPLKRNGIIYAILGIGKNITERKKAELRLKDSEDVFKALYKEGPIAAYTWKKLNDDFVLIDFNNAAENLTQGNVLNVLGHKASVMYKDRSDILEDLYKCFNEKTHTTREMRYKFQFTGENKYLLVNYGYVKPDLVIVQTEDITEKRIAEEKLRESEEKYRSILENMQDGYFEVDLNGNYTFVNDYHCKFLGYSKDELIGMNYRDIIEKKTINEVFNKFRQLYNEETTRAIFESKVLRNDGVKRIIDGTAYLKFDSKGKKVGFYGFTRDITEKIEAEERLLESEKKYRYLYENSPFSIVLINSKEEIVDCNPRTEIMFGYLKADLLGKKFHKIPVFHPDYLPTIIDLFEKFIKGEKMHRIDLQMYRKDRSLLWVNLQASIVQVENEYLVQALFIDVSTRKEAEFLINREIKKLKELDQIRKNLISRVAHELKTPLASVCGGTEFLTSVYNDQMGEEELEILTLIDKGGNRLKYLVDNLIDISRMEYDKFKLKKDMSNLCELINECSKEMEHLIKKRTLSVDLKLPDKLWLDIDRIRIEQVITNLLSNAVKNTPPKGRITVKVEKQENWVILSISDTGVGLTKEEMEIIFTRFGKIERYGEGLEYIDIQGSGLGLFISKEIVDLHGGNIRAESGGRGKGSTFIVELPII